jgi:hypothetical protein
VVLALDHDESVVALGEGWVAKMLATPEVRDDL